MGKWVFGWEEFGEMIEIHYLNKYCLIKVEDDKEN